MTITIEELREAVSYSDDGYFYWNKRVDGTRGSATFNTKFAGKRVDGELDRLGYLRFQIRGVRIKYHRAVFAYHHGYYPETVDHINRVRSDNRIENLRSATLSEQQWNKSQKPGTSGVVGVYKKKARWVAAIREAGVRRHLGSFQTMEGACRAYEIAVAARCTL